MSLTFNGLNGLSFGDGTSQNTAASGFGFKNRIINGDMRIDQRNVGASVTPSATATNVYTVDRWFYYQSQASKFAVDQNAGSITPPVGFGHYLGLTSQSAYSVTSSDYFGIGQIIEGFNTADFAWGTVNAATITLSFRVYSSLTGTFGGSIQTASQSRSYPFTYSVGSANTWTTIAVTIPGDTGGTWVGASASGSIRVNFGLGMGSSFSGSAGTWASANYISATGATNVVSTNGATFYITGVQLEKNPTITEFDYLPITTAINLCERYFEKSYAIGTAPGTADTLVQSIGLGIYTNTPASYNRFGNVYFRTTKRASPTIVLYAPATGSSAASSCATSGDGGTNIGYVTANQVSTKGFNLAASVGGSTVTNYYTGFFAYTSECEL